MDEQYEKELAEYEQKETRWNSLFYCHRCDGVFVPGDEKLAPLP